MSRATSFSKTTENWTLDHPKTNGKQEIGPCIKCCFCSVFCVLILGKFGCIWKTRDLPIYPCKPVKKHVFDGMALGLDWPTISGLNECQVALTVNDMRHCGPGFLDLAPKYWNSCCCITARTPSSQFSFVDSSVRLPLKEKQHKTISMADRWAVIGFKGDWTTISNVNRCCYINYQRLNLSYTYLFPHLPGESF